ncbi:MAG: hypothetical protein Q7T16_05000 [Candidatus Burarchaeum sp.]|nr:hypothetical protein [Candidatus Burarchaeum sp.]MDO8339987.1 hypothetical protein [Candidatus Burarchaeum sp.]
MTPGQNFTITLTAREAPLLGENDTKQVNAANETVTTRQRNSLVFEGKLTNDSKGVLSLMGMVRYTMSFRTAIQGQGETNGSPFDPGTPVVVLGETRYVSTPYLDQQAGKVHLGDMPISKYVGLNQEASTSWKEVSDGGPALVGVFARVIGIKETEVFFDDPKYSASMVFGTDTPAGRYQISTPTMLSAGISYGVDLPDSQPRDLGVLNLQVVPMKVRQGDAYIRMFVNSDEISNPGAITRARFGAGLVTEIERGNGKVRELTFSNSLLLPANVQFPLFNSGLLIWTTRDTTGAPVVVFSSPYL